MTTLGFIGVGTITSAFVAGLRRAGRDNPIVLSPRSEARSTALERRFAGVRRARSNAEVAAEAEIVILSVLPAQVETALADVAFHGGQILASFVTGLFVPDLADLAPRSRVARVLPLPTIEYGRGPVVVFPRNETLMSLLQGMGDVVVPESEDELRAMGAVSGFMSTFLELELALADWLQRRGVGAGNAGLYVGSMLAGLSEVRRSTSPLAEEFETRGGLNARTRAHLKRLDWFDQPGKAFDEIAKLDRRDLS